jgi:type IV pilus assembly protein PilM
MRLPSLSSLPTQVSGLKDLKISSVKDLNLNIGLGRRGGSVVGLDIQPGLIAAVQARGSGSIVIEKAVAMPLAPDMLRDGEVNDDEALSDALRELFKDSGLSKRVRVGIANQRTVLRTLELPPVTDNKELEAAVNFQAQEQVPMPLNNAVLDFHPLGVIDTPAGPRQRVVLVAAQRDMVERLLGAIERAGLTAEGLDLSAFALIRSLYAPGAETSEQAERVLYLNVDGLTNLAIAEGSLCRFTRVVGGGIEAMASELAAKREITVQEARNLLLSAQLPQNEPVEEWTGADAPDAGTSDAVAPDAAHGAELPETAMPESGMPEGPEAPEDAVAPHDHAIPVADAMPVPDADAVAGTSEPAPEPSASDGPVDWDPASADSSDFDAGYGEEDGYAEDADADIWAVLDSGIREIYGEVRNSLDFHRSQEGGGEVSHVVLSGCAQDIPGFAEALQSALGVEVKTREVRVTEAPMGGISAHRLAVAAGLAVGEIEQ